MGVQRFLLVLIAGLLFMPLSADSQRFRERRIVHTSYKDFLSGWCPPDQAPVVDLRGAVRGEVTAFGGPALPKPRDPDVLQWFEFPQPGHLYATAEKPGQLDELWLYQRPTFIGPLRWRLWGQLPASVAPDWIVAAHGSLWCIASRGLGYSIFRAVETDYGGPWITVSDLPENAEPEGFFLSGDDQLAIPARLPSGELINFIGDFTGNGESLTLKRIRGIVPRLFESKSGRLPAVYANRFSLGGSARVDRLEWTLPDGFQGYVRVRYRCALTDDQPYGGWSVFSRRSPIYIGRMCQYCEYQIVFPSTFGGSLAVEEVALIYREKDEELAFGPGSSGSGGVGGSVGSEPEAVIATRDQTSPAESPSQFSTEASKVEPVLAAGDMPGGEMTSEPGNVVEETPQRQAPPAAPPSGPEPEPSAPAEVSREVGPPAPEEQPEELPRPPGGPSEQPESPERIPSPPDSEVKQAEEASAPLPEDLQSFEGDRQSMGMAADRESQPVNGEASVSSERLASGGGVSAAPPPEPAEDVPTEPQLEEDPEERETGLFNGGSPPGAGHAEEETGSLATPGASDVEAVVIESGATEIKAGGGGSVSGGKSGVAGSGGSSGKIVLDATLSLGSPPGGAEDVLVAGGPEEEISSQVPWWVFAILALTAGFVIAFAVRKKQRESGTVLVRSLSQARSASTFSGDHDGGPGTPLGGAVGGRGAGGGAGRGGAGAGRTFLDPSRWGGHRHPGATGGSGGPRFTAPTTQRRDSRPRDPSLGPQPTVRKPPQNPGNSAAADQKIHSRQRPSLFGLALPPFFYLFRRKIVTSFRE